MVLYEIVNECHVKQGSKPLLFHDHSLHEGVVDGDDKSLTSLLELGVVHEARNVSAGARRACKRGSVSIGNCIVFEVQVTH